ncbi:hypothetical protein [Mycolicibacterium phocaicum]|uniref:hypothetical protein n=1 Tax=Mycolicibacterium phocaicum TaxID=319706 RepID=UPI00092A6335|nr:hypothetical protein [Mycolicibacterium phocaicum]UCZ62354.1 hypothetical protein LHJ73_09295 [Mycolicibacterium phocaicum]SHW35942.1 Ribonucleases G and E [Mycobacteroides abscessus subsp. abscessus]
MQDVTPISPPPMLRARGRQAPSVAATTSTSDPSQTTDHGAGIPLNRDARRRLPRPRPVRVTRVAAIATASALALALTGATEPIWTGSRDHRAVANFAFSLTSATSSFQTEIDQILAAQQAVVANNSNYSFATEFDKTLLPQYARLVATGQLFNALGKFNLDNSITQNGQSVPYTWNAPGANPITNMNISNPDTPYLFTHVGGDTQVMTVRPGPGTADFSITTSKGDYLANGDIIPHRAYNLTGFTPNSDGTYTIVLSSTPQPGNWIDTSDDHSILVRNTTGDWGLLRDTVTLHTPGQPDVVLPPRLSKTQISDVLNQISSTFASVNSSRFLLGLQTIQNSLPNNTFTPIALTSNAVGASNSFQLSSFGHFSLEPGQALVVKVPNIDAGYTGFQINDAWTYALPYAAASGTLNNTQTFKAADGFTYYVISSTDPGVANWIDSSNNPDGNVFLRWQALQDGTAPAIPIETQVVNVANVRDTLPADTPVVTPTQRKAELQQRLLEWGYSLHQNNNLGWITSNLELDQIKNAVGQDAFNQMFVGQTGVPSVLDRATSAALMPNIGAVARAVLANPAGSLSAVVNNLPLLVNDIGLPMVLAVVRLQMHIGQTVQIVADDLAAGHPEKVLGDLGSGVRGLGTLVGQTLTDPATSVTAGFLNARDDLGVTLMHADSYKLSSADFGRALNQITEFGRSATQVMFAGMGYLAPTNTSSSAPAAASTQPTSNTPASAAVNTPQPTSSTTQAAVTTSPAASSAAAAVVSASPVESRSATAPANSPSTTSTASTSTATSSPSASRPERTKPTGKGKAAKPANAGTDSTGTPSTGEASAPGSDTDASASTASTGSSKAHGGGTRSSQNRPTTKNDKPNTGPSGRSTTHGQGERTVRAASSSSN